MTSRTMVVADDPRVSRIQDEEHSALNLPNVKHISQFTASHEQRASPIQCSIWHGDGYRTAPRVLLPSEEGCWGYHLFLVGLKQSSFVLFAGPGVLVLVGVWYGV